VDNKLTLVVVIWLSGVIAGGIIVARWLRMGEHQVALTPTAPQVEEPPPQPSGRVQRAAQRIVEPVITGARIDLQAARTATNAVTRRFTHVG
jgi:hypothetical protein